MLMCMVIDFGKIRSPCLQFLQFNKDTTNIIKYRQIALLHARAD